MGCFGYIGLGNYLEKLGKVCKSWGLFEKSWGFVIETGGVIEKNLAKYWQKGEKGRNLV